MFPTRSDSAFQHAIHRVVILVRGDEIGEADLGLGILLFAFVQMYRPRRRRFRALAGAPGLWARAWAVLPP